jgi:transcriptional regulator with XRE-family HTH domain
MAGISQIELAKKLKRSQTFVTRMETGRRRIDVVEYLELAEVIGFDAAKLIEATPMRARARLHRLRRRSGASGRARATKPKSCGIPATCTAA